ncbi:aminobenzoyl-glutamate utilization protein B [Bryocella elongata]|uniref:Aminobenzoyl-glutamate utilization protein B n=1 Tax=Bryocella elongata TaxID=863522 RepID=A0A1H5VTU4_9BACT|nr:amidohydrolase [Bryocella elongata]SEF90729.1 aminobenzoyl-glutamate utilization protein B [Bryocella elongata]
MKRLLACSALLALAPAVWAQSSVSAHKELKAIVDEHAQQWKDVSKQVWDYAEMGYHENKSSTLLQQQLKAAGFSIQAGVADEPTGFIASYGSGKPVIAILGEFDALPGLSQKAVPDRDPVVDGAPGHGCGHNLLGAGAALAVVSVKQYMAEHHIAGTLRFYGTPAEEGGSGKVYMVRDGLFKDVDVVLQWHPGNSNTVANGGALAVDSAKFTFHGVAAHAAMSPDRGRSALDAVMLMGTGLEYMREHVPATTRIHYIISKGGAAPNIVPDLAQMDLMARSPFNQTLAGVWARILDVAKGAALMTGTTLEVTDIGSDANIIPNDALAPVAQKNLEEVGGYTMTPDQKAFAIELRKSLNAESIPSLDVTEKVQPLRTYDPNQPSASTDVGDVSWNVPTIGFSTATFVPGVAAHSWQAAASAGMSIGQTGMVIASKALALTAIDLFTTPQLVSDAKADFDKQLAGKTYSSPIPAGQKPLINYRGK